MSATLFKVVKVVVDQKSLAREEAFHGLMVMLLQIKLFYNYLFFIDQMTRSNIAYVAHKGLVS